MKVSSVSYLNNSLNFKSSRNALRDENVNTNTQTNPNYLKKGLKALGIIGMASLGLYALYKQGSGVPKNNVDTIEKILDGRRDKAAVDVYKKYIAEKKMASLENRLKNGEFSFAPQNIRNHIEKNMFTYAKISGKIPNII